MGAAHILLSAVQRKCDKVEQARILLHILLGQRHARREIFPHAFLNARPDDFRVPHLLRPVVQPHGKLLVILRQRKGQKHVALYILQAEHRLILHQFVHSWPL